MAYNFQSVYTVYCLSDVCDFVKKNILPAHRAREYINEHECIKKLYAEYESNPKKASRSWKVFVVGIMLKDICNMHDFVPTESLFLVSLWAGWMFPYYYEYARKLLHE